MDKILIWITKLHDTKVSSESQIWKKKTICWLKKNLTLVWVDDDTKVSKKSMYQKLMKF